MAAAARNRHRPRPCGIGGGGFARAHPGPRPRLGDRLSTAVLRRDDWGHDGDYLGSVRALCVHLIQFAPVQLAAARSCRTDQLRLWLVPDLPDRLRRWRAIHRRPELAAAMSCAEGLSSAEPPDNDATDNQAGVYLRHERCGIAVARVHAAIRG